VRGLVWFRRDLRIRDNPALSAAVEDCEDVSGLFVFDEPLLKSGVFGSACINFMLGCLKELAVGLKGIGIPLFWARGDQTEEVVRIVRERAVERIYWNRDYEPAAVDRDRLIQQELSHRGITICSFKDHVIFEAGEVTGSSGQPLQRYSAYRNRWWSAWREAAPSVLSAPRKRPAASQTQSIPWNQWPSASDFGYEAVTPWIQPGETSAHRRLRWFLNGPVHRYSTGRNLPAIDGTARLSPHFRFGTLSARTAVHLALRRLEQDRDVSRADVQMWINELVWRDFFQQILAAFPEVATGPFRMKAELPPYRGERSERERLFRAWCEGRTGYPLVDAGMRQLNRTGWMHNRVRMIVASFLIKDLRLDWRCGERYFMRHLLDADLAANNGNWQWCAGTGTDAMRGYRMFNSALQSRRFDPDGDYIKQHVPELLKLPARWIHEPHVMPLEAQQAYGCRVGRDYPKPIVDHGQARLEYLELARRGKQRL
jgi:deoxyribodipyrimidine photo-lyase